MIVVETGLLILSAISTVVVVRFFSGRNKWNSYMTTTLGFILFPIILGTLVLIAFLGPMMPLEAWVNQWKVVTLERHLYVGEPRVAFEAELGKTIPSPDLRTCCGTAPEQNQPASIKWHERYFYLVAGSVCMAEYQGVAVRFDRRERVRSWRRVETGIGC